MPAFEGDEPLEGNGLKKDVAPSGHLVARNHGRFPARSEQFRLDHIFTIGMFKQALRCLPQEDLNVGNINQIVKDNYAVAWITKDENHYLDTRGCRSKRGVSLTDALRVYNEAGIHLMDEDGKTVS